MATPTGGTALVADQKPEPNKTFTNWRALMEAKVRPVMITCQGYQPTNPHDISCHTKLKLSADAIVQHIKADHGGSFRMLFKECDTPWDGWLKFIDAGLESVDFRCERCDMKIPFHVNKILFHMKDHNGKLRRLLPGKLYNIHLSIGRPELSDDEAFTENG
jgi:hypothetical protein